MAVLAAKPALPYELATHAAITYQAYNRSKLAINQGLRRDLGLDWYLVDTSARDATFDSAYGTTIPFNSTYYDSSSSDTERQAHEFEFRIIKDLTIPPLTLPGWLMRGAVREDDAGNRFVRPKGEPANDDPYGDINRWCNHFFDPTKPAGQRKADFFCLFDVRDDAVNWATGSTDAFASPSQPDTSRRNHFTVVDAREAMYRALTGRKSDGTGAGGAGLDADMTTRKAYWATTFRALGDVMHLNQDMAQPQHTRNESHAGITARNFMGNPIYEKYLDARVRGQAEFEINGTVISSPPLLNFGTYDAVKFTSYSDFWSTAPGQAIPSGRGLADYSSRGFFTPASNFGNSKYPSPSSALGAYSRETIAFSRGYSATYLVRDVPDSYAGGSDRLHQTREGTWLDFLRDGSTGYVLDRTVFDDMANVLIPRAVGYSAGLLNFFFRGKIEMKLPDEGVYGFVDHATKTIAASDLRTNNTGFDKIKLKLSAPAMGYDDQPQQFSGGKLLAVLKFRRNLCNDPSGTNFDLSGVKDLDALSGDKYKYDTCRTTEDEVVVSDPANGGAMVSLTTADQPFTFSFQKALPMNATDVRLQVVYRGQLGTEANAVAVATQDLSEPTFFSYINASDYYAISTPTGIEAHTRDEVNGNQALLQAVQPSSCIDRNVTPNQLKSSCLNTFDLKLGLKVGTTTINVDSLPVRRFVRIAMLGDAKGSSSLAQDAANSCFPHTAFTVSGLEWQSNADPATNATNVIYPSTGKVRGIHGWYATSCIGNADGLAPGASDNRNQVMTELSTEEKSPWMVTINGGNGF